MPHLADTNILTRFTNVNDSQHVLVSEAVRALLLQGETLYYTQQNSEGVLERLHATRRRKRVGLHRG